MRIYMAGAMFTRADKEYNLRLAGDAPGTRVRCLLPERERTDQRQVPNRCHRQVDLRRRYRRARGVECRASPGQRGLRLELGGRLHGRAREVRRSGPVFRRHRHGDRYPACKVFPTRPNPASTIRPAISTSWSSAASRFARHLPHRSEAIARLIEVRDEAGRRDLTVHPASGSLPAAAFGTMVRAVWDGLAMAAGLPGHSIGGESWWRRSAGSGSPRSWHSRCSR